MFGYQDPINAYIQAVWAKEMKKVSAGEKSDLTLIAFFRPEEVEVMRNQVFGDVCSKCQTFLATEADFYGHFVPSTTWSRNLGSCRTSPIQ